MQKTDSSPLTRLIAGREPPSPGSILVTVGIPAYRHAQYIDDCLAGLLACTRRAAIQIIVIDDCSPDDTADKAVAALSASDLAFRVYRNETNQGLSYGLDFLLSTAAGDHFLVCASDDIIVGQALDRLLDSIQTGGGPSSFQICGARYIGSWKGSVYDAEHLSRLTAQPESLYKWLCTEIPKPLLLQSTVFDTAFIRRLNPWADRLILDDWPTFIRATRLALTENLPIRFTPEIELTQYRVHDQGLHANVERQRKACFQVVDKVIPAEHRRVARAHVLSEFVTADLSQRSYARAVKGYLQAIATYPRPDTALRVPIAVTRELSRRLWRKLKPD